MKIKFISILIFFYLLLFPVQSFAAKDQLILDKLPVDSAQETGGSSCYTLMYIDIGTDIADMRSLSCYHRAGQYTLTLAGPSGTAVTLYGDFKYGKRNGYLVIQKRDDKLVWILNLEKFAAGKWVNENATRDSGAYKVFYHAVPNFSQKVSSIKWGKWWESKPPAKIISPKPLEGKRLNKKVKDEPKKNEQINNKPSPQRHKKDSTENLQEKMMAEYEELLGLDGIKPEEWPEGIENHNQDRINYWSDFLSKYPSNPYRKEIEGKLHLLLASVSPEYKNKGNGNRGGNVTGMKFIPGGQFLAGPPGSGDVKVIEAFYIDIYEVTQQEFVNVMGNNPSHFKGRRLPVEGVSWPEAKEFCKRNKKRLPTSLEWEKAARAGSISKYYWGDSLKKNQANCESCGSRWDGIKTSPVGSFPPNSIGLYDMAGNVWEWTSTKRDQVNMVIRGGSWGDSASYMKTSEFYFIPPDNRSYDVGFRCTLGKGKSIVPMKKISDNNSLQNEKEQLAEAKVLPQENVKIARLKSKEIETASADASGTDGMVLIPAGKFVSGEFMSQKDKMLEAFYIDTHEVTQKEFESVMMKNPSRFKGGYNPVEKVTWHEAQKYCHRLGKRLPKGDEWEKAARAGTSSNYPWGNSLGENKANCPDCGSQWDGLKTAPVGSFPANAWGLYDMAGNVWEWVDETHNEKFKVLRGGSWMDDASFIKPAASYFVLPKNRSSDVGFRCVKDATSAK